MSIELAKRLLEDWFSRRGLRLEYEGDRELVLLEGNNRVYVRISDEEFPTESQIIDELSSAMKNRLNYNKAYIAFPINARGLINGKLFRSHWVGVYLYDLSSTDPDRAVEELIPSIPIQIPQGFNEEVIKRLSDLEVKVNELMSRLTSTAPAQSLARDVEELKGRLSKIENLVNELMSRVSKLESAGVGAGRGVASTGGGVSGELPDFLSNNPWIEVLRRRGGGSG